MTTFPTNRSSGQWTRSACPALLSLRLVLAVLLIATPTFAQDPYYPPLDSYVDTSALPQDLLAPAEGASPGELIKVRSFLYSEISVTEGGEKRDIGARITASLQLDDPLPLVMPGFETAFSAEIGTGVFTATLTILGEELAGLSSEALATISVPDLADQPFHCLIEATELPLAFALDPAFFVPMRKVGDTYEPSTTDDDSDGSVDPAKIQVELTTGLSLVLGHSWSGDTSFEFDDGLGAGSFPSFSVDTAAQLGDTGVVVEFKGVRVDFSSDASPAGAPDAAWQGVQIESATFAFLNGLEDGSGKPLGGETLGLGLSGFLGRGGFTGGVSASGLSLDFTLFGMEATLDSVGLQFDQNSLTGGSVGATLKQMPFFEGPLALTLALDMSGNFKIGLATPDGSILSWTIDGVLTFDVESIAFEQRDELFLVRLNGSLEPLFFSEVGATPESAEDSRIEVNGLTITSAGDISLDGGWITLPSKKYLGWNSFRMGLSQIGFGRTEETSSRSWFGFTGGIELAAGFGAEAEMKRLQFLWDPANLAAGVDVKLDGIRIAYSQPGVLTFEGDVEWFEAVGDSKLGAAGFAGKLAVSIPAINFSSASRVVIGSAEEDGNEFKFFYIDLEAQFPVGFPLGQSGVSLYGLAGMFAYNMTPNLSAFDSPVVWYEAYRTAANVVGGSPPPWRIQDESLAFGAGVILGTTPDNGFTVNGKVALTIAIPGPVVILSGQAALLTGRASLSDPAQRPPFTALAVFDGNTGTFLINIGVFYEQPYLLTVSGEAEAFFNLLDPTDWHLYLGQKDPESRRITADVLSLLKANAYFMIEPDAFAFGAKAQFGDKWKFGPLKVVLMAWFGYDAELSWRPVFAWGSIDMGGEVELSAFGVGVGLSASATLELRTPTPFYVDGKFKVKLNLPWPLPDPGATVHLRWEKAAEPEPLAQVVADATLHARQGDLTFTPDLLRHGGGSGAPGTPATTISASDLSSPSLSMPAEGSAAITTPIPMVPLDSFAGVKFEQSVNDFGNVDSGAPGNAFSDDKDFRQIVTFEGTEYEYDVSSIELVMGEKLGATIALTDTPVGLYATWTSIPLSGSAPANNNLNVVSKNNFGYFDHVTSLGFGPGDSEWVDWIGYHYGGLFCLDGLKSPERSRMWPFRTWSDVPGTTGWIWHPTDPPSGCPIDVSYLADDDFILPPYHAFQLTVDGFVRDPDDDPSAAIRQYRDSIQFHTEGPPLLLDDYVRWTVPEFSSHPYYRGYDVGLVFTENYLNKLYRRDDGLFFQLELLDDNEIPIAGADGLPSSVETHWDKARDSVWTASEEAWIELLEALGALSSVTLATDDLVHARVDEESSVRSSERHLVRTWFRDDRLASDARLLDSAWLDRNLLNYVSPDRRSVVLHDFAFVASRYVGFQDLVESYAGACFEADVDAAATRAAIAGLIEPFDRELQTPALAVSATNSQEIGVFLRNFLAPRASGELAPEELRAYIDRTPGFTGEADAMTDGQVLAVTAAWDGAAAVFEQLDALLGLETEKSRLPDQLEVIVLRLTGEAVGMLLEFPEAVDFSRVEAQVQSTLDGAYRPTLVPNRADTRAFLFHRAGGTVSDIADGQHDLTLTFHRDLGEHHPFYFARDGALTEEATVSITLPDDLFQTGGE